MDETTGTPALNKALAEVQAKLPKITKGETAKVPGKDGKQGYSYRYAGLDTISAHLLPLLGEHGLSFTAKPTLNGDGKFVLAYSLKHASGEHDDGEFPLGGGGGTPQAIGSAITYARRYCLCAVTGVAPDEDDDGQAAEHHARDNGEDWRNLEPVNRPRRDRGTNGHAPQPARQAAGPQVPARQPAADDGLLQAWGAKIDEITDAATAMAVRDEVAAANLDPQVADAVSGGIDAKLRTLNGAHGGSGPALGESPQRTRAPKDGNGNDEEWIRDFKARLREAREGDLTMMRREVGQAVMHRKITPDTSAVLTGEVATRRRELEGASA